MKKLFLMVAMLFVVNGTVTAQETAPATTEVEVKEERSVLVGGRLGRRLARAARKQEGDVIVTLRGPCDVVRGVGRYVIDTGCRMTNGACEIVKAPFTTPCRLPKARKFLYQRPIFIPGRLIPLNDCEKKKTHLLISLRLICQQDPAKPPLVLKMILMDKLWLPAGK